MKKLLGVFLTLMILSYPFSLYFASQKIEPRLITLAYAFLFGLKVWVIDSKNSNPLLKPIFFTIVSLCGLSYIFNHLSLMYYIPCLVNLSLLSIFTYSLFNPPSIIERFARIQNPELPNSAIVYCRIVTMVWCSFFIINALIVCYLAYYQHYETWTYYTGVYSYLLIGLLFMIEFLVRILIKKKLDELG